MATDIVERLRKPITRVNAEVALLCEVAQEAATEILRLRSELEEAKKDAGWQPIETAPKDGTPVDIWRTAHGGERCVNMRRVSLGADNVFYEPVEAGPSCVRDASHWMPIPAAPAIDSEIAKG